ncbi:diaminopimelate decarboxylase [Siphonobacter sp.]|uniref:diaminopimelate decarboxylase n=1 Tax=Siphonobacter sp. TaxID=1869184 RepID=UPI003B3B52F0
MQLREGSYFIQNQKVTDLAERFGTPLYVYDGDKIIQQIQSIHQAFAGIDLKIKYACKALTSLAVLKLMRKYGVDLDVVSPQELQIGLLAGYAGNQMNFTPSGVSFDEIEFAVEQGAFVNLDNLDVLEKFGQKYGSSKPCMIRVKPNVAAGGNAKIMTAHEGSKFGIDIRQKAEILALVEKYDLKIVGLHQHTGSDVKEASAFIEAASRVFEFAYDFPDLQCIDLGGGFKVAYKEGDYTTDMEKFGAELSGFFREFCEKYGRNLQLWFEPGKYLVSECGYLLVSANVVKEAPGRTFVGVNSGLNHLIRPMMYDAYHHIVNASNPDDSEQDVYDVVGYICETDNFALGRTLNKVKANDILAILNAGAYGFAMSSQYNSRLRPAEVLVLNGEAHVIRQRETLEDVLRNQVEIDVY